MFVYYIAVSIVLEFIFVWPFFLLAKVIKSGPANMVLVWIGGILALLINAGCFIAWVISAIHGNF